MGYQRHNSDSGCKNMTPSLFSEEECDRLDAILKKNYESEWLKKRFVFREEENTTEIPDETPVARGILQSELFDSTELDAEFKKRQAEELEGKIKAANQSAELPYYDNPQNDNERMINLQFEFVKHQDINAWGELLEKAFLMTKHLIWKWLKAHPGEYMDEIAQDEQASITVEYVFRRYKTTPGWYAKNFVMVLKDGLRHARSYHTKMDEMTDCVEDVNAKIISQKTERR